MRVLIIDDELELTQLLEQCLKQNGFSADIYHTKLDAIEAIRSTQYVAVILDRGLPDGDGLSVISDLRAIYPASKLPPFLVLTALGDTSQKVDGLTSGAVDYIVKPYDPDELIARLRICIETKQNIGGKTLKVGNLLYKPLRQILEVNGKPLQLRRRELAIFDVLMRNVGTVVSHDRVEEYVYGIGEHISSNTLQAHVSRLRKALEDCNAGVTLRVMRNIGYILQSDT